SGEIFEQVSVDHSVVQELMDRGEISAEQAKVHPYRHMVTRALGAGPDSDPDYWLIPAETGDRMLVCSDGLSGEVDDDAIDPMPAGTTTSASWWSKRSRWWARPSPPRTPRTTRRSRRTARTTRSTRTRCRVGSPRTAADDERGERRRGHDAARDRDLDQAGPR